MCPLRVVNSAGVTIVNESSGLLVSFLKTLTFTPKWTLTTFSDNGYPIKLDNSFVVLCEIVLHIDAERDWNKMDLLYKRSILFQSRSASICRTISQRTTNELSSFIGYPLSEKVVKVHLGVNVKVFKKETSNPDDSFTIVTPAELTTRKGHIYAIEASKMLVDMGITNFKWFFYGSGRCHKKTI